MADNKVPLVCIEIARSEAVRWRQLQEAYREYSKLRLLGAQFLAMRSVEERLAELEADIDELRALDGDSDH